MPYQLMILGRDECNNTVANRNAGKSLKTLTLGRWSAAGFQTTYFLNANQAHIAATHCCLPLYIKALHFAQFVLNGRMTMNNWDTERSSPCILHHTLMAFVWRK